MGSEDSVAASVARACQRVGHERTRLMDILWEVQHEQRCVNREAMKLIAAELGTYQVAVEGLITFYAFFSEEPQGEVVIRLCDDIVDQYAGLEDVAKTFSEESGIAVGETREDGCFTLEYTPCISMCDQAPAAMVNEVIVTNLNPERAREICRALAEYMDPAQLAGEPADGSNADPHIHAMVRNNIELRGDVLLGDVPENAGLDRALALTPEAVVQEIVASGLRSCGGAGFSTGRRWGLTAVAEATERYIICNADEGKPGTFKDRVLLAERPDLLIEAMTIAAWAMAYRHGIIYLRAAYEYLLHWLEHRLQARRDSGLLGNKMGDKEGFDFDIRIQLGTGGYICGEEGALINSC